jgi:uncharacterized protein DUF1761
MTSFNFWPILIASVVAFAISALWYSPVLFGKEWMALSGISDSDVTESSRKGIWKLYVIQFITTLVTFSVLAFIITTVNGRTAGDGIFLAFLAWLGFPAMGAIGNIMWNKQPVKLALITTLATLICWMIGGAIIGAWR